MGGISQGPGTFINVANLVFDGVSHPQFGVGDFIEIEATASIAAFLAPGDRRVEAFFEVLIDSASFGGGIGFTISLAPDGLVASFVHNSGAVVFRVPVASIPGGPSHTIALRMTTAGFNSANVQINLPQDNASLYIQETTT